MTDFDSKFEAIIDAARDRIAETVPEVQAARKVIDNDDKRTIAILKELGAKIAEVEATHAQNDSGDVEYTIDGEKITDEQFEAFKSSVTEFYGETAYDMGMEWDGDETDPCFWEPSSC